MKEILNFLFKGNSLSRQQASETLKEIGEGKHTESEIASFLTIFNMRPLKAEELAGFRDAMIDLCLPVNLSEYNTIDVCGTGGDGKNTFNISTLSAFVIAGAGYKVAKHGNYGLSSPCGSSNIFEHFGYKLSNDVSKLKNEIEKTNLCYFHAPLFHPAMKYVAPVRKALKVKTFFNMLGPLLNPSKPQNQFTGTFDQEAFDLYGQVFKHLGTNHVIVHSLEGYDEISLTCDFQCNINGKEETISPNTIYRPEELFGGNTIEEAAAIFSNVLENKGTRAQMDVALTNAAFGLKCFLPEAGINECLAAAKESVESGKALNVLKSIIKLNDN